MENGTKIETKYVIRLDNIEPNGDLCPTYFVDYGVNDKGRFVPIFSKDFKKADELSNGVVNNVLTCIERSIKFDKCEIDFDKIKILEMRVCTTKTITNITKIQKKVKNI